jgi:peroxiredoxin
MALTPTKPIPLGFQPPAFSLLNVISGKKTTYDDIRGEKGTLVMFICNHCPYVVHVIDELVAIGREYMPKGIGMVAINSNDVEKYPADSPAKMIVFAKEKKFPFVYLYDKTQEVAKAYDAACTPDFNLFDKENKCVYRGQLDSSRPGNDTPVNGADLRRALDQVLRGKAVPEKQIPSTGCNIKWK